MEISEILKRVDHTLLDRCATEEDIKGLLDDGVRFGVASVCIPPCYVKMASEYLCGKLPICTVVGFPNGYATASVKAEEASLAVADGADEVDMVINLGFVKSERYDLVNEEIQAVRRATQGKILKVIIETCLLTEDEKIKLCRLVAQSGADYIKTSTGFSTGGATEDDVALMVKHSQPIKVKAAGGISSIADAERFIELGADRLGTSRIVKILKNQEAKGY